MPWLEELLWPSSGQCIGPQFRYIFDLPRRDMQLEHNQLKSKGSLFLLRRKPPKQEVLLTSLVLDGIVGPRRFLVQGRAMVELHRS